MADSLLDFFDDCEFEFDDKELAGTISSDDLFSILESLENAPPPLTVVPLDDEAVKLSPKRLVSQKSITSCSVQQDCLETEFAEASTKRRKISAEPSTTEVVTDGQQKTSHIAVERNRRKQMNEHLSVLRSLMPCFYVKRGDQASIIGGVVDYIKEMQQVLQSLEAKKQRKVYSEVLSPRLVSSSPKPLPLSPRKPPLSPRLSLPASPRTPKQTSPYKPRMNKQTGYLSPTISSSTTTLEPSLSCSSSSLDNNVKELVTNSKSSVAKVEVKFSGPNVLLKTISARIPGQVTKIIAALEALSLEILHVSIGTVDATTMLNSFTIKIGIECALSAEELALEIQQTFC
ncbi:Myc-type [Macleaya cordata]|uniref:Myc-type n=1 Tax=Macleaya cordata TaxID=56857 RepID=A0A200PUN6_MACCD|nr:Myc-type [Macleaya cordata]